MNFKSLLPKRLRSDVTTIPVVRMSGAIMAGTSPLRTSLNLATVAGPLEKAFATKGPAVAISINSPGGSPVQSRLIYRRIRDLAKEKKKHVHVFCEDAAASGGYMIACAGDDITADPSSIIGSIGVISASFGFTEAIEKLGIERRLHTAGQNKSTLDPFSPEKPEDVERLKELQLEIHDVFIDLVKESRGDRLSDDPDLFTGRFWTGVPAQELGLVDAVGDMRSALKAKYGEKTRMQLIEAKRGLFGRRSMFGIENVGAVATERLIAEADSRALWSRIGL
ncbi:MAG: S49 family peptidase [Pseudomonadota bacterium]